MAILFDGTSLGRLGGSGRFGASILGKSQLSEITGIGGILLPDVPEAVALLALNLAELRNLGVRHPHPGNAAFGRAVDRLARRLTDNPELSSQMQQAAVQEARARREASMHDFGGAAAPQE